MDESGNGHAAQHPSPDDAPFIVHSHRGPYTLQRAALADALPGGLTPADRLLVDRKILDLHPFVARLAAGRQIHAVTADESLKSLDGVVPILTWILDSGFHSAGALYVIGGGTVQDAGAFVASILHRGTRWIYVPTTLLAQSDSCIGSKSSLNFRGYKNQLGTFYPPASIIVDDTFLNTLPNEEVRAGIGEMLHYALLGGEGIYAEFERALTYSWESLTPTELSALAWRVLAVKRTFIEEDEFDTDVRRNLNFGHAFAHGIEYASAGKIPHGTAVAYGVDLANSYAQARGVLGLTAAGRIGRLIRTVVDGSELALVSAATVLEGISKDKNRTRDELELVLLSGLGRPLRLSVPIDEHLRLFLEDYLASW